MQLFLKYTLNSEIPKRKNHACLTLHFHFRLVEEHEKVKMSKNLEAYDSALLGILQHEGQIAKFLDVVLGFLYRR